MLDPNLLSGTRRIIKGRGDSTREDYASSKDTDLKSSLLKRIWSAGAPNDSTYPDGTWKKFEKEVDLILDDKYIQENTALKLVYIKDLYKSVLDINETLKTNINQISTIALAIKDLKADTSLTLNLSEIIVYTQNLTNDLWAYLIALTKIIGVDQEGNLTWLTTDSLKYSDLLQKIESITGNHSESIGAFYTSLMGSITNMPTPIHTTDLARVYQNIYLSVQNMNIVVWGVNNIVNDLSKYQNTTTVTQHITNIEALIPVLELIIDSLDNIIDEGGENLLVLSACLDELINVEKPMDLIATMPKVDDVKKWLGLYNSEYSIKYTNRINNLKLRLDKLAIAIGMTNGSGSLDAFFYNRYAGTDSGCLSGAYENPSSVGFLNDLFAFNSATINYDQFAVGDISQLSLAIYSGTPISSTTNAPMVINALRRQPMMFPPSNYIYSEKTYSDETLLITTFGNDTAHHIMASDVYDSINPRSLTQISVSGGIRADRMKDPPFFRITHPEIRDMKFAMPVPITEGPNRYTGIPSPSQGFTAPFFVFDNYDMTVKVFDAKIDSDTSEINDIILRKIIEIPLEQGEDTKAVDPYGWEFTYAGIVHSGTYEFDNGIYDIGVQPDFSFGKLYSSAVFAATKTNKNGVVSNLWYSIYIPSATSEDVSKQGLQYIYSGEGTSANTLAVDPNIRLAFSDLHATIGLSGSSLVCMTKNGEVKQGFLEYSGKYPYSFTGHFSNLEINPFSDIVFCRTCNSHTSLGTRWGYMTCDQLEPDESSNDLRRIRFYTPSSTAEQWANWDLGTLTMWSSTIDEHISKYAHAHVANNASATSLYDVLPSHEARITGIEDTILSYLIPVGITSFNTAIDALTSPFADIGASGVMGASWSGVNGAKLIDTQNWSGEFPLGLNAICNATLNSTYIGGFGIIEVDAGSLSDSPMTISFTFDPAGGTSLQYQETLSFPHGTDPTPRSLRLMQIRKDFRWP